MKKIKLLVFFIFLVASLSAQERSGKRDSLLKALQASGSDNEKFNIRFQLIIDTWSDPDLALQYAQQNLLTARKVRSDSLLAIAFIQYKILSSLTGNYPQALQYAFESLHAAERTKNFILIGDCYDGLGDVYTDQGDLKRAIFYLVKAKTFLDEHVTLPITLSKNTDTSNSYLNELLALAKAYEKDGQPDSAIKYLEVIDKWGGKDIPWASQRYYSIYGDISLKKGDHNKAILYYRLGGNDHGIAYTFKKMDQSDSVIFYANQVLAINKQAQRPAQMAAYALLSEAYKAKHNIDSAAKYFELTLAAKDTLFNQSKFVQLQNLTFDEQVRQQELLENEQKRLYRYRLYGLMAGLGLVGIIAFMLYRNNKHKQKAFAVLQKQKDETEHQRNITQATLEQLRSAQAQLIQREKLASLGELTAGIAHEIQNPLNFVNNFSEINKELIVELKEELITGNNKDAIEIASNIQQNEQKINHHGKRADAIVKGMLQHSRSSSGAKEPTDINKLADEYLRLSYQGLRAKDKAFNATMQTDFDASIGKINIIPQDIGRVLLNLFNNAFYAASLPSPEKIGTGTGGFSDPANKKQPTVTVSTSKNPPSGGRGAEVLISVKDNGNGIHTKNSRQNIPTILHHQANRTGNGIRFIIKL